VAAIRPDLAESLPADRVRPAAEEPPGHRFQTGTQCHEAVAGTTAAIDYLRSLGGGSLDAAFALIAEHEDALSRRFLAGLPEAVELYGIRSPEGRTPTFCFNLPARGPREVAELLAERDIYVWDGDYYALEPMRALGLAERGGAVRAGFLHYSSCPDARRGAGSLAARPRGWRRWPAGSRASSARSAAARGRRWRARASRLSAASTPRPRRARRGR
jgi:selenocysteine lyase/cysteine desulfurase